MRVHRTVVVRLDDDEAFDIDVISSSLKPIRMRVMEVTHVGSDDAEVRGFPFTAKGRPGRAWVKGRCAFDALPLEVRNEIGRGPL